MIRIVKGDLCDATEPVIAHQVNCQGVMGSGVAKALRNKFPGLFEHYEKACRTRASKASLLGCYQVFEHLPSKKIILNLFAQLDYTKNWVSSATSLQTSYEDLEFCLAGVAMYLSNNNLKSIAMPYNLGCGRGGGDWSKVLPIIERTLGEFDVVLYQL